MRQLCVVIAVIALLSAWPRAVPPLEILNRRDGTRLLLVEDLIQ